MGSPDLLSGYWSISEEEGTDLCCVISSLAQLMLDPYYRTLLGFQSLVQKEWVAGCHAFMDRCNHLNQKDKEVIIACLYLPAVSSEAKWNCYCFICSVSQNPYKHLLFFQKKESKLQIFVILFQVSFYTGYSKAYVMFMVWNQTFLWFNVYPFSPSLCF